MQNPGSVGSILGKQLESRCLSPTESLKVDCLGTSGLGDRVYYKRGRDAQARVQSQERLVSFA
jgi:hypothetical protein